MSSFPIFDECSKRTDDPYWKDLFSSCANNKFPKGLRYDDTKNKLYVRVDSKTNVFALPSDPDTLFDLMMTIFTTNMKLLSPQETAQRKQDMADMLQMESLDDMEWKQVSRSRTSKDLLVSGYVEKLSQTYNLTSKECKNLFSLINLAFQFKKITAEDVTFGNGEIESINGLTYDESTRTFAVEGSEKNPTKTNKTTKQDPLYKSIDAYLREYMTRYRQ